MGALLPEPVVGDWALRHPEALLLLLLAGWALRRLVRRRPASLAWPALPEALAAGARVRDPDRWLAGGLRAGALCALAVAAAGPVRLDPAAPPLERGLDLLLVLDASQSMQALDAQVDGEWRMRLDLARQVVARFARQRAASGDRVGLVVFGEQAFTQCPLTRDGALLAASLERVRPGVAGSATALGDALALAVKRVTAARASVASPGEREAPVVVLLTDGRNNAGKIPVDVATELARARGVRVHTVGIGSVGPVAVERPEGAAGRGLRFERHDLDAEALERIAAWTGGRAFRALGGDDLAAVYETIDALERSERPAAAASLASPRPEPWLALAAGLVATEILALGAARRALP